MTPVQMPAKTDLDFPNPADSGAARSVHHLLYCRRHHRPMGAASVPALFARVLNTGCAMKRAKSKSGNWAAALPSAASPIVRFFSRDMKGWKWVVDDRMRDYGETDYERRIVRINRALHRKHGVSILDTLLHEEFHVQYPFLIERMVCELTSVCLPRLSARDKARLYAKLRRRNRL